MQRYCLVGICLLLPGAAQSQTAPLAPTETPAPVAAPAPQPHENPGLVNEIEKLTKNPSSILPDIKLGGDDKPTAPAPPPQPAPAAPPPPPAAVAAPPSPAPQPAPPAASSSSLMPGLVTGRQPCPNAGNGEDCKVAADALCKAKGYQGGRSLGVDATEKCSAKLLIPGRARQPGDCKTENYVTRAWCQ